MKVTIDLQKCQGYANCIIEAPDVFDLDPTTGKAHLLVAEPSPDQHDEVASAVRNCPVDAISVEP